MSVISLKKTLNLHKYSVKAKDFLLNWNYMVPLIISLTGIILGCKIGKDARGVYLIISKGYCDIFLGNNFSLGSDFIQSLLISTIFAGILFFFGLCAYGAVISNAVPFCYGIMIGIVSFYFYQNYTLKGLAYCMILVFPYAVLSLYSINLCCRESINMANMIIHKISSKERYIDYSFNTYITRFFKSYLYIPAAAVLKTVLDYLFIDIFTF
ncbi:MAG: hypothetical protein PUB20_05070 [Clostridia bacterium]|nr:hypothetical protein [Clostridia bacterium]